MLRGMDSFQIITINILMFTVWHFVVFIACILISPSAFDCKKQCYRPIDWEKSGKWYSTHLKIKKWKDLVPQHIGKHGFSKRHFESLSVEYIDEFIFETCRGEWNHKRCSLYAIIAIIINPFWYGVCFALMTLILNLACVAIQRYNRFRLINVKSRRLK